MRERSSSLKRHLVVRAAVASVVMFAAGAGAATGVARLAGWEIRIEPYTAEEDLVVLESDQATIALPVDEGTGQEVIDTLENGGMLLELQGETLLVTPQP